MLLPQINPLHSRRHTTVPAPPTPETAPSPCLECVPAWEGIGRSGRVGGRLDPSPPTPFPFQFPVLLPSSPPCWAFLPSPLCQGSLENQERETARTWVSHGPGPFPRDVIAWEVGAPVRTLHWLRWEEAGAGRGHCRARREGLRLKTKPCWRGYAQGLHSV